MKSIRETDTGGRALRRVSLTAAAALLLMATGGCDDVTQTVACGAFSEFDVDVDLTGTLPQWDIGTVVTSTASGRSDLPNLELNAIGLTDDQVTFDGTGSGTVEYVFAVNDTVVGYGTATITQGALTAAPGKIVIGGANQAAQVTAVINSVPAAERPSWAIVAADVARAVITRAARSSTFTISAAFSSTRDVMGEGSIQEVTFYLEC